MTIKAGEQQQDIYYDPREGSLREQFLQLFLGYPFDGTYNYRFRYLTYDEQVLETDWLESRNRKLVVLDPFQEKIRLIYFAVANWVFCRVASRRAA